MVPFMLSIIIVGVVFLVILLYTYFSDMSGGDDKEKFVLRYSGPSDDITEGKMTLDIRKNHDFNEEGIKEGEAVIIDKDKGKHLIEISKIRYYESIDDALKEEDIKKIYPGMSKEEAVEKLKGFFDDEEISNIAKMKDGKGVLAFDIKYISEYNDEDKDEAEE